MKTDTLVLKYTPNDIDDYLLDEELKNKIKTFIKNKNIPHICMSGKPGIGKTTLAQLIAKKLNAEILFIKSSVNTSVSHVRNKIKEFCDTLTMDGTLKVVILDEIDGSSKDAQESLRQIIDEAQSDTRFILTSNYGNKILPALKSRCMLLDIQFSHKELIEYLLNILKKEKINYAENFKLFAKYVIKNIFPDVRASINYLESCLSDNFLIYNDKFNNSRIREFIEQLFIEINKSVFKARQLVIQKSEVFNDDWENLAGEIFNYVVESEVYSHEQKGRLLKIIASFIIRINRVEINKDIQFCAMLLEIASNVQEH